MGGMRQWEVWDSLNIPPLFEFQKFKLFSQDGVLLTLLPVPFWPEGSWFLERLSELLVFKPNCRVFVIKDLWPFAFYKNLLYNFKYI